MPFDRHMLAHFALAVLEDEVANAHYVITIVNELTKAFLDGRPILRTEVRHRFALSLGQRLPRLHRHPLLPRVATFLAHIACFHGRRLLSFSRALPAPPEHVVLAAALRAAARGV